ncbi:MAG: Ham1 family protein [Candidatus Saccharibacteria bacterium]|nr:Ham1 family protein [Candidatus Saccharibacteria bacterium]
MIPIFVTGNKGKVDAVKKWLGYELPHEDIDLEELQELDARVVVEHKARQAYEILKKPVLIDDTSLIFNALGRLPGTLIKWFLSELDLEKCCRLLDSFDDRTATARVMLGLFDGHEMHIFDAEVPGSIAQHPKGDGGFGWNSIFIPKGSEKTYAEMDDKDLDIYAVRKKTVTQLKTYLDKLEA